MKGLLLIAHGSRRTSANDEFMKLVEKVHIQSKHNFDSIRGCFLELAQPQIINSVIDMANLGVTRLWVLPYFLTYGKHMEVDIPKDLQLVTELLKNREIMIDIEILPHVGASTMMSSLIEDSLSNCSDDYYSSDSSCRYYLH